MELPNTISKPRKKTVPLIIEPHPKDYGGFNFITLVQYRKQPMLTVIDNIDGDTIRAFVLDYCGPEEVDQDTLFAVAGHWYDHNKANYPISVEFAMRGLTSLYSKIYRSLNIEFVSRVIGPVPKYPIHSISSVKRRRRKPLPIGVEIVDESFNPSIEI